MLLPKYFQLETSNLRLRIPSLSDIPHVFSATRTNGFNDGMLWEAPINKAELIAPLQRNLMAWSEGKGYTFTIEQKGSCEFLGRISIRKTKQFNVWNTGFWTHPEHQGQGVMTEALKAIIDFGFTKLSASMIEAEYALWNKASEQVLKKCGMQFVRSIKKGFVKNGQWVEENAMEIERKEWKLNIDGNR